MYGNFYQPYAQPTTVPRVQALPPVQTPQPVQAEAPVQNAFKVIPVATPEEAAAIPTDFMGSTLIMPDFAHGAIHTKTLNPNTGAGVFLTFRLPEAPQAQPEIIFDPKAEIERLTAEITALRNEIESLKPETTEAKKK